MTCAGLTMLALARDQQYGDGRGAPKAVGDAIERGLAWVDANFQPSSNAYEMACVMRVGTLTGRRQFNDMDWYASTVDYLTKYAHSDGRLSVRAHGRSEFAYTALAVMFITEGALSQIP
jgi:hypothetical protein